MDYVKEIEFLTSKDNLTDKEIENVIEKIKTVNSTLQGMKYRCFLKILLNLLSRNRSSYVLQVFLEFAIKANNPAITLEFLEMETDLKNVENLLKITYYKGIIYLMLKRREEAVQEFKKNLIIPSSRTSQIQVEALRKLLLVELITKTSDARLGVGRVLLKEAEKYLEFVDIYKSGNLKKIKDFVGKEGDVFKRHGNWGLVKQVLASENYLLTEFQKLQKVYSRILLKDLGSVKILNCKSLDLVEYRLEEFENFLTNLPNTGIVVDDRSGEIIFSEQLKARNLKEISKRLQAISENFLEFNRNLQLSEEYVSRVVSRSEMVESRLFDDRLQEMDF
jgi:tetratricopeptide (TPR) repeat protein